MGIYTGHRIGDILKIKIGDVHNKVDLNIRDSKTKKENKLEFHNELFKALKEFTKDKDSDDFLIKSRQGYNKPISRTQAYRILQEVADEFKIDSIGCHSLRKTFGYHLYFATNKDVVQVQKALNHSHPSVTLRYIGIEQEDTNKAIQKLNF